MKRIAFLMTMSVLIIACGGGNSNDTSVDPYATSTTPSSQNPTYDPNRGEGKFTQIELSEKLDAEMAKSGEKIYNVKCGSCHKLSAERLVGPGWAGVTKRHTPEWIMNFATNTDAMIDKDPEVQAQLEICLVRMPNQNIADDEARGILEFMRKNDGVK